MKKWFKSLLHKNKRKTFVFEDTIALKIQESKSECSEKTG